MNLALTLIHELIRELDKRAVEHHAYGHIAQCHICGGLGEEYQHTHKVDCVLVRAAAFTHAPRDPRVERLIAAAIELNEANREGGNCQRTVDAEYDLLAAARGEGQ